MVQNYINIINNHNIKPKEVFLTDRNELINIGNKFKNNKSAGLDMLQTVDLKNMPPIIFEVLANVFIFCLVNGYFLKIFKNS